MDEITKGMEELVKMSKDMVDLSEEIKRDLQKIVGQDEFDQRDNKNEDSNFEPEN